jgi:hypothetical protein
VPLLRFARLRALWLLLWLPFLVELGFGTAWPWLDRLAAPAAWIAALPAALGVPGAATAGLLTLLALLHDRLGRAGPVLLGLGTLCAQVALLALLAALLPLARPLPWLLLLPFAGPPRREDPWTLPGPVVTALGLPAWLLAARLRPFGPGLGPEGLDDAVAACFSALPALLAPVPGALSAAACAVVLARRAPPRARGACVGLFSSLLLHHLFASADDPWNAAAVGLLAGSWPINWRGLARSAHSPLLAFLAIAALGAWGRATVDRWRCDGDADPRLHWLSREPGAVAVAALPGNVPAAAVLTDGGQRLLRFGPAGVAGGEIRVTPPGGQLVAPPLDGANLGRVTLIPGGLRAEWRDGDDLSLQEGREFRLTCTTPGRATMDPATRSLWVPCPRDGVVHILPRDASVAPSTWAIERGLLHAEALDGGALLLRGGPFARATLFGRDRSPLETASMGPFAAGLAIVPERFAVARGPLGVVDLRGAGPTVAGVPELEPPPPGPAGTRKGTLGHSLDQPRVGHWAADPQPAGPSRLWLSSPVEGRVTLMDIDVTWLVATFRVGAPVRAMSSDAGSGTLFAASRCGVFQLHVPNIDPWSRTDVAPAAKAP